MSDRAPDVAEHVVGYRAWRLRRDGRLISAGAGATVWTPGVNTAACVLGAEHTAPAGDCSCGLYAFHDPPPAPSPGTVGAVRAHGDLESHHDGFRAQHAQIVALAMRGRRPRRRERRAARVYGVPLVGFEELVDVAGEHGRPLEVSLRPERAVDELLDECPWLAPIYGLLERGYARVAGSLRRRPRARSVALAAIAYAPYATFAAWGYLAALAMDHRDTIGGAWWLSLVPWLIASMAMLARLAFGSRWMRPARAWIIPALLLLAGPLQFSDALGVAGVAIDAATWTVGLLAVAVVVGGLYRVRQPLVLASTLVWLVALPVAIGRWPGLLLTLLAGVALVQYAILFPTVTRRLVALGGAR